MPTNNEKLQHIIEQICTNGCDRVNEIIEQLEHNHCIDETSTLDKDESRIVLQELKAIMAVYEQDK